MNLDLTIIIPAYNEEQRIGKTLNDYLPFFNKTFGKRFELLVILNGCKDNTLRVVQRYRAYHQLRYKNIPAPIGKGGALIEGFKLAHGRLIGFVDADDSTKAKEFIKLIRALETADGAIASRWVHGAVTTPPQPLLRRIASRAFNMLVRALFGLHLRDTQCGGKLFRNGALHTVLPSLGITSWAFDIDLLYLFKRHHYRILEVPIRWENREGSKLNIPKAAVEMFLAVTRLRLLYSPLSFVITIYDWFIITLKKFFPF